jgi:hypothetical protein
MVKLRPKCGVVKQRYLRQPGEQRLGVLQVGGVEAFGEAAIDRRQQLARRVSPALSL